MISGRPSSRGFGLVEIAISLAIISFALVSLIGLMAVGLEAGKASREDTMVAALIRSEVTKLASQGYTNITGATNFLNFEGMPTNETEAYYLHVTKVRPADDPGLPAGVRERATNVTLQFSWPYKRSGKMLNEQVFTTTITEY